MKLALGVDIGGTKTSLTLGDSHGKILAKKILPTLTGRRTHEGIKQISEGLLRLKADFSGAGKIKGIGVGIPGPIDPQAGTAQRSPNLRGWEGIRFKAYLQKKLKLPVYITNDANAAAIGEMLFGQGRNCRNFVYLTVSTGIGGGIVLGGRLLMGDSWGAGEIGHTIVQARGERCGCGRRGCLEAYASGTAIAKFFQKNSRGSGRLSAESIAREARQNNFAAREAYCRAGFYLGIGLANLINLLNPGKIILGGSVTKSFSLFWPTMMKSVRAHAWPVLSKACRIVKTDLEEGAGDLGALALVFSPSSLRGAGPSCRE